MNLEACLVRDVFAAIEVDCFSTSSMLQQVQYDMSLRNPNTESFPRGIQYVEVSAESGSSNDCLVGVASVA